MCKIDGNNQENGLPSWQLSLAVGVCVWWSDPDGGESSGAYSVVALPAGGVVDGKTEITIENECKRAVAHAAELSELGPRASQKSVPVEHWASARYRVDQGLVPVGGQKFEMEIEDRRETTGQLWVTTSAEGGSVDDMLAVCLEVNQLRPEDGDTQAAHVHFDSDNLAFTIFKQGDRYLLRLETGVTLKQEHLADGAIIWVVE